MVSIFVWLSLISFSLLGNNESNVDSRDNSICFEMKKLHPKLSSDADYSAYVAQLIKNGFSVCECQKVLLQAKQQKAEASLQKEHDFISSEDFQWIKTGGGNFNELDPYYKEMNELYKLKHPHLLYNSNLSYDPILPESLIKKIKQLAQKYLILAPIYIKNEDKESACRVSYDADHIFHGGYHILQIGPKMLNEKDITQESMLRHEFEHMKNFHVIKIRNLWKLFNASGIKNETESLLKYLRFQEAEADRMPCACESKEISAASLSFFEKVKKTKCAKKKRNLLFYGSRAELKAEQIAGNSKSTHPSYNKRIEWAERLYRLKKAEASINKS